MPRMSIVALVLAGCAGPTGQVRTPPESDASDSGIATADSGVDAGPCAAGMVHIEDFCIDAYEAPF